VHVRLARTSAAGGLTFRLAAIALALLALTIGCRPGTPVGTVEAAWTVEPGPPKAGEPTRVVVRLRDGSGNAVPGARLTVDAQMDHPMAPVSGEATESAPGVYELPLTFPMGGNWTLIASGTLPDGTRISKSLDVSNVQ
jgi:hypothetical protein